MDKRAITQSTQRIQKARSALDRLNRAKTFLEMQSAWVDIIQPCGTIYNKLEQGAKGYGRSEAWFGRKKKERRDDDLLKYMWQARNSDEHGIVEIISEQEGYQAQGSFMKVTGFKGSIVGEPEFYDGTGKKYAVTKIVDFGLKTVKNS